MRSNEGAASRTVISGLASIALYIYCPVATTLLIFSNVLISGLAPIALYIYCPVASILLSNAAATFGDGDGEQIVSLILGDRNKLLCEEQKKGRNHKIQKKPALLYSVSSWEPLYSQVLYTILKCGGTTLFSSALISGLASIALCIYCPVATTLFSSAGATS